MEDCEKVCSPESLKGENFETTRICGERVVRLPGWDMQLCEEDITCLFVFQRHQREPRAIAGTIPIWFCYCPAMRVSRFRWPP